MDTATATQPRNRQGSTVQAAFERLRGELEDRIIGQQQLVEHLLIALLADGHLVWPRPPRSRSWHAASRVISTACNSRPTCSPAT